MDFYVPMYADRQACACTSWRRRGGCGPLSRAGGRIRCSRRSLRRGFGVVLKVRWEDAVEVVGDELDELLPGELAGRRQTLGARRRDRRGWSLQRRRNQQEPGEQRGGG